jgi:hypothetical protein
MNLRENLKKIVSVSSFPVLVLTSIGEDNVSVFPPRFELGLIFLGGACEVEKKCVLRLSHIFSP